MGAVPSLPTALPVSRVSPTERKEGYCYNDTGNGLSIKCVCMSFSSILSVVFTFTRANVSILTFLFSPFNCRMDRRLRFSLPFILKRWNVVLMVFTPKGILCYLFSFRLRNEEG